VLASRFAVACLPFDPSASSGLRAGLTGTPQAFIPEELSVSLAWFSPAMSIIVDSKRYVKPIFAVAVQYTLYGLERVLVVLDAIEEF